MSVSDGSQEQMQNTLDLVDELEGHLHPDRAAAAFAEATIILEVINDGSTSALICQDLFLVHGVVVIFRI
jgi:hypothetical protein